MKVNNNLHTNIMEKLRAAPTIDESSISVVVKEKGLIVLGGKVRNYSESYLVESVINRIISVRWIINKLEIESDRDILKAVLEALRRTIHVPHKKIKVLVEEGHLTLSGKVQYIYQKECSEKAVENLYGITFITNNIVIKPNTISFEIEEGIIKELEHNIEENAIRRDILLSTNVNAITNELEERLYII
jgi:osmotically-inducible protein OsmY